MGACTSLMKGGDIDGKVSVQRRRLSVIPAHVGNINPEALARSLDEDAPIRATPTFAALTRKGYVPYNDKKKNQDSYVISNLTSDVILYGVFDGHGEIGHQVSAFITESLPRFLTMELANSNDYHRVIHLANMNMCNALNMQHINLQFSGSTAVYSLYVQSLNKLYTANIGDSRAVLATTEKWEPLSHDHRPDVAAERDRILKAGGRVEPLPGPVDEDRGPLRVWLAELDIPGLAMSRSIGDKVSHTVGVIDTPDIDEHDLENASFIIWATDGIWEFITSEEAVEIVRESFPNIQKAAANLAEIGKRRWLDAEEVVDDITVIVAGFNANNDENVI